MYRTRGHHPHVGTGIRTANFYHPDFHCRPRNFTESALAGQFRNPDRPFWRKVAGFNRRWGISPRPEVEVRFRVLITRKPY